MQVLKHVKLNKMLMYLFLCYALGLHYALIRHYSFHCNFLALLLCIFLLFNFSIILSTWYSRYH
jgi:hypothetical protein